MPEMETPFDATTMLAAFHERVLAEQQAAEEEDNQRAGARARAQAQAQAQAIKKAQGGTTACEFCGWSLTKLRAYYIEPEADSEDEGTVVWLCPNHYRLMRGLIPTAPTRASVLTALILAVREKC